MGVLNKNFGMIRFRDINKGDTETLGNENYLVNIKKIKSLDIND